MLYKHGLTYLWARGVPGLINFAALALYTRLVLPEQFGIYATVMAGVFLLNALTYQWLRLSLLRFLSVSTNKNLLLPTILRCFGFITFLLLLLVLPALSLIQDRSVQQIIIVGLLILIFHSWFELNLDILKAQLKSSQFGYASVTKAVLVITIGSSLALLNWGAWGLLIGFTLGTLVPSAVLTYTIWKDINLKDFDQDLLKSMFKYGFPLTLSLTCSLIIRISDRLLLNGLIGPAATGVYSASYDLAQNSLEVLMAIVNAAAFSLAVNALDTKGLQAARQQLSQNIILLTAVALPATVGLMMVAPNLTRLILGDNYHAHSSQLIAWIAAGVFLSGIRAYYIDHAFQLGKQTTLLVYVLLTAAIANIALNLFWIPVNGILGAAHATFTSYFIALILGLILSPRAFPLPWPLKELFKVFISVLGMFLILFYLPQIFNVHSLVFKVSIGVLTYIAGLFLLNGLHLRTKLIKRFNLI